MMSEKLKQRIKKIADTNSNNLPVGIFIAIALITSIVAKHMEFSFVITLLISLTILIGLATTIQITRNKKNLRMILFGRDYILCSHDNYCMDDTIILENVC